MMEEDFLAKTIKWQSAEKIQLEGHTTIKVFRKEVKLLEMAGVNVNETVQEFLVELLKAALCK